MCHRFEKRYPACRSGNTRIYFLYCIRHTIDPITNLQKECNYILPGAVQYAADNHLCPFDWCQTCTADKRARRATQRAKLSESKEGRGQDKS